MSASTYPWNSELHGVIDKGWRKSKESERPEILYKKLWKYALYILKPRSGCKWKGKKKTHTNPNAADTQSIKTIKIKYSLNMVSIYCNSPRPSTCLSSQGNTLLTPTKPFGDTPYVSSKNFTWEGRWREWYLHLTVVKEKIYCPRKREYPLPCHVSKNLKPNPRHTYLHTYIHTYIHQSRLAMSIRKCSRDPHMVGKICTFWPLGLNPQFGTTLVSQKMQF